jgi:hypothetical protein
LPDFMGANGSARIQIYWPPKSELSHFPCFIFLADSVKILPLSEPSPHSQAPVQSSSFPFLTSTWKCSCSQVTFPTLSWSRQRDSLWPEPSNAARAPAVHSSSDAVNLTSECGKTSVKVKMGAETKAGKGLKVA